LINSRTGLPTLQRRLLLLCLALVLAGISLGSAGLDPIVPGLPFKDVDDIMRMLQVLAWRDGGDWYDLTQYRIDPPLGLTMHWSRLPDLPLIGLLMMTEPWLGRDGAIRMTATLVPVLLTLIYFMVFVWSARPLTGRESSHLAGLMALCTSLPLLLFTAGRIDHHNWQLILAMILAGGLLRLAAGERQSWLAPLMGGTAAAGLWVGAEAIPAMALASLALTLLWWQQGPWAARQLAWFGISALASTLLLLPLVLAPGHRLDSSCDAFSLYSVALAGAVALFGAGGVALAARPGLDGSISRSLASLLLALPGLALLGLAFPQCLTNPYGAIEPAAAQLAAMTSESIPLGLFLVGDKVTAAYLLALPLAGLILVTWLLFLGPKTQRPLWTVLFILVAGTFILPWWQGRGSFLANAYAGLAFTWLAALLGASADQTRNLLARMAKRLGPAALVALIPPAAAHLAKSAAGPQTASQPVACDLSPALDLLNQPQLRLKAPQLIAAPIFDAARILWSSPQAVLAGPYHRNAQGLRDYLGIVTGKEDGVKAIIARRQIAFLLVCPVEVEKILQALGKDDSFLQGLSFGSRPNWLERMPVAGNILLFRVLPEEDRAADH